MDLLPVASVDHQFGRSAVLRHLHDTGCLAKENDPVGFPAHTKWDGGIDQGDRGTAADGNLLDPLVGVRKIRDPFTVR